MLEIQANTQSSDLFPALWNSLNPLQQRWAIARLHASTDSEAGIEVGVSPDVARHWKNKKDVDRAVSMMIANARDTAMGILEAGLVEAATIKLKGMREQGSNDKQLAQAAASEIMDRLLGKPTQRIAPINPDGTAYSPGTSQEQQEQQDRRLLEILEAARSRRIQAEQAAGAIVQAQDVRITTLPIDTPNTDKAALEGKE